MVTLGGPDSLVSVISARWAKVNTTRNQRLADACFRDRKFLCNLSKRAALYIEGCRFLENSLLIVMMKANLFKRLGLVSSCKAPPTKLKTPLGFSPAAFLLFGRSGEVNERSRTGGEARVRQKGEERLFGRSEATPAGASARRREINPATPTKFKRLACKAGLLNLSGVAGRREPSAVRRVGSQKSREAIYARPKAARRAPGRSPA